MAHLLTGGASRAYNLGNGTPFSVREVIAAVERVTGKAVPHTIGPRRDGDPAASVCLGRARAARAGLGAEAGRPGHHRGQRVAVAPAASAGVRLAAASAGRLAGQDHRVSEFLRLLRYARPYRGRLIAAAARDARVRRGLGAARLSGQADLRRGAGPSRSGSAEVTLAIVVAYLVKGLGAYFSTYLMTDVGQLVVRDVRNALFGHIARPVGELLRAPDQRPADVARDERRHADPAGGVGDRRRSPA